MNVDFKHLAQRMKELGAEDAKAGKPIEAYYDIPNARHTESLRAAYEVGWRAAVEDMRKAAQSRNTPHS